MLLRLIKVALTLMLALLALFYATQNVVNLEQAHGAVAYVLGRTDHAVYPGSFLPALNAPALSWTTLAVIIGLEYVTGLVLLKGSFDLWRARGADPRSFDNAKRLAVAGAGLGMLVWFGLFHTLGGALFQQWQTQAGSGSLQGAFWYGGIMALTALYIALVPED